MVQVVTTLRGSKPLQLPDGEKILEIASMQGWVIAAATDGLYVQEGTSDWVKVGVSALRELNKEIAKRDEAIEKLETRLAEPAAVKKPRSAS
jgi:hypothetical protein